MGEDRYLQRQRYQRPSAGTPALARRGRAGRRLPAGIEAAALRDAGYGAIWHGQKSWNGVAILARGADPTETGRGLPGDLEGTQSRYIEAAGRSSTTSSDGSRVFPRVSVGPSASYMTGFPSMATGTIEDNEAIPVVSITPLDAVKAEGGGAFLPWTTYTFTVTRTGPTDQSLNVFFSTSGGVAPATDGADCPAA